VTDLHATGSRAAKYPASNLLLPGDRIRVRLEPTIYTVVTCDRTPWGDYVRAENADLRMHVGTYISGDMAVLWQRVS
jgi:D-serine deaminase-like pyridoxal phosphate-dependent protein